MADMRQLLQGMVELNDGVAQAEERAVEAERPAQATPQHPAPTQQEH